jgi:hypothetical protein
MTLEVKMSKGMRQLVVVVGALVLCAGVVFSADQARDQKRDGDGPVQEQLRDGSCQPEGIETSGDMEQTRAGNGAAELKQSQNGPAAGTEDSDRTQTRSGEDAAKGDADRDRDQLQDGSCQD